MGRFAKIQIALVLVTVGAIISCAPSVSVKGPQDKQNAYDVDEQILETWHNRLNNKDYLVVNNEIQKFLKSSANSQHWYEILFTLGRAKEGLEDWSEAIETYQQIVERSTDRQMEFVALADFRMAYCYEIQLNNEKALAALTDALRLQAYLPLEIAKAEIPARIASVYSRMNQILLADKYTRKAEDGLKQVRALKRNFDNETVSRTLLRMGEVPLGHLDEESFRQSMETLMRNQRYLIQAIEIGTPTQIKKAEQSLSGTYIKLWSFIENFKLPPTMDRESDLVNESAKRADFLSIFLESIERLKTYEAPIDSTAHAQTLDVYHGIESLQTKALALLNQELLKKPWPMLSKERQRTSPPVPNRIESAHDIHLDTPSRPDYIPITLPKKRIK